MSDTFHVPSYEEVKKKTTNITKISLFKPKGISASPTTQVLDVSKSVEASDQIVIQKTFSSNASTSSTYFSTSSTTMPPISSASNVPSLRFLNTEFNSYICSATMTSPSSIVRRSNNNILVNPCQVHFVSDGILISYQKGNRVLKYIKNVGWEFDSNVLADYVVGSEMAALFLSLRYHLLNPDYIQSRMKPLVNAHKCRLLLCLVDIVHFHFFNHSPSARKIVRRH